MITRREFFINSLEALCSIGVVSLLVGCADKKKRRTPFRLDYNTFLGVGVQMPSWINSADHAEIGSIVDKYIIDFHAFLGEQASVGGLRLIIPERIKSFASDASYTGCAAGLYVPWEDLILCSWGKEGDTSYPTRKNILPAFPHELSHRWLRKHNMSDKHEDFPQYVLDADAYAQQQSAEFLGDFSLYNPSSYNPNSCQ
ncbi:hypothetical protein HY484_04220 [Candidatus Woesearchaeota archaeon]|nr:hypothetical protein [Candidatus Woesearchaeota archaeon]